MERPSQARLSYVDKNILAPMVRVVRAAERAFTRNNKALQGTLPMRLLSLEMGADICYVEEIIDKKIVASKRIENRAAPLMTPRAVSHISVHHIDDLGTVDFIGKDNTLVFRTNTLDHPNVFQIGTADATLALQAAQMVINDVDAIDINMGCPKHFSVSGGMGAALLSKPQVVKEILTTLVRNLPKPVTCKIRLLDRMEDTLDLVRVIESTGVSALAVHCRTVAERPRDPAHWDRLPLIRSTLSPAIPLIANGDVFQYSDFQRVRTETGASSVMVARGAMWNPSIFRAEGALPLDEVISRYIRLAVDTDAVYQNTKVPIAYVCGSFLAVVLMAILQYVVMEMLKGASRLDSPVGEQIVHAKSMQDVCAPFGVSTARVPLPRAGEGFAKKPRIDGEGKKEA